ncbi:flavodoxin domain-containing protein [Aeromicrobium sp.]|uniref:flavodoxin domain-containing protein n=1 Tax=Aeromicrobium sp. TaxID=1871063 RepID=UPI002FCB1DB3
MTALAPSRTLVVAAASRHGGTCEIADRLAWTLENDLPLGWRVIRPDLTDLQVLDDADAVVLGSAIYYGRWMRAAARALAYLKDAPLFDLWLFSTGPVSDVESENAQIISADSMVEAGQAIEHKVFGGRLDTSRLSWVERTVVKAVHAIPGDHRDWDEVDEWAHHIAQKLSVVPGTDGTTDISGQDAVR